MSLYELKIQQSSRAMKIVGWILIVGLTAGLLFYPPGFFWGSTNIPLPGPAHPPSNLDAFHPYIFMLGMMYLAHGILLIRGAKDPIANSALFDYGILANLLHATSMIPMVFLYPNEHAHLWADIPFAYLVVGALWYWHPKQFIHLK